MTEILILPKSVTPTFTFDKLYIRSMIVTPFVNAKLFIEIHLIDTTNFLTEEQCRISRMIEMTNEEYNLWSTDAYLVDFVCAKLLLTKQ